MSKFLLSNPQENNDIAIAAYLMKGSFT